jgi:hypothetical protein
MQRRPAITRRVTIQEYFNSQQRPLSSGAYLLRHLLIYELVQEFVTKTPVYPSSCQLLVPKTIPRPQSLSRRKVLPKSFPRHAFADSRFLLRENRKSTLNNVQRAIFGNGTRGLVDGFVAQPYDFY